MSSGNSFRPLYYLNILSIDVALGAMTSCAFFANVFGLALYSYSYITLGLTVWIIYTCDHLLDVRRHPGPAATERHRFHQKHFYALRYLVILCVITAGIQVIFIRRPIFIGGLLVSAIVLIYFLLVKRLKFLKEISAALLYTAGVLIAPLSLLERSLTLAEYGLVLQFFITALINLLLFSWFGVREDKLDQHSSFVIMFGEKSTRSTLVVLFILQAGITIAQILQRERSPASVVILMMTLVLLGILVKRKYFEVNDRYRLAGDAVFLMPIIYLALK